MISLTAPKEVLPMNSDQIRRELDFVTNVGGWTVTELRDVIVARYTRDGRDCEGMIVFHRDGPENRVFSVVTVFYGFERDAEDGGMHWSRAVVDPDDSRRPSAVVTREAFPSSQQTTLC
jgi:hypothetical protein